MARKNRRSLPEAVRQDIWQRWKAGESLSDIGRAVGKVPGSIHHVIAENGGVMPRFRQRSKRHLSLTEREDISRGLVVGDSLRKIAEQLGRAPSTISREVARHGGKRDYRAVHANERAWENARRPKRCLLAMNLKLRQVVIDKLELDWSPEQISAWLKMNFVEDTRMRISPETIYRSLFIQARGVLKKELITHLRRRRTMRRSKLATTAGQPRGQIIDAVSIRDRPAEVEDRAIPGHWEGDLIFGSKNSTLATLVERRSRFVMLVKLAGKDTTSVVTALTKQVKQLPEGLMASLTWDRGGEMASYKRFTVATDVQMYFCDPRSPWQRGTNENTNGLLRQYFPKKTDLSPYTQETLDAIALKLNQRPRKTLGFLTPADVFYDTVALTH